MRKQEGTSILSLHPGAKAGCKQSPTGKCEKCPLYRFVEMDHPQTGEKVREWDCVYVWQVMWAGQSAKEVRGAHAAIAQQTNLQTQANRDFLALAAEARKGAPALTQPHMKRINGQDHANSQD